MPDASAQCGFVKHFDNRPMDVGDRHFGSMAPDNLRAEYFSWVQMLEGKIEALAGLLPLTDCLAGHDDDILEDLLGKVPVFRGGAARHVGGREELGDEDPTVIKDALRAERVE